MQDEDVVFRSFKGIAFISIAPLIALSASLWFTSDSVAYFLAHLGQIYFSIILFFLFGNIWSIRNFESSKYKKELTLISFIPTSTAILGAFLTVYINPAWGWWRSRSLLRPRLRAASCALAGWPKVRE